MNINSPTREVLSCWTDRFALGGSATLAFQRSEAFSSSDSDTFFNLRQASLFTDVALNKQMSFHMMMSTESSMTDGLPTSAAEVTGSLTLDEAYLTVSDFMKSPMYVKAGKGFTSFGNYSDTHPTVRSINQGFVEANNTHFALGFASNAGYDLSAFLYEDETNDQWNQYGIRLGYKGDLMGAMKDMNFGFNLSYVDNYSTLNGDNSENPTTGSNADQDKAAYDVAANISVRNFNLCLEYFKVGGVVESAGTTSTAEPKVLGVTGSYDYMVGDKKADVHVMYEKASDASSMTTVAFATSAEKHINLGVNYDLDKNAKFSLDYHKFESFTSTDQKQIVAAVKVLF
ncbi:MAG: LbtU family siderophore porin [Legionellales bacterium]|nr:LbtU family siderophore porin [Legionellales bacterium]